MNTPDLTVLDFLKYTPEMLNLVVAYLGLRTLLKLTQMRLEAAAGSKNPIEPPAKAGFWSSFAWVCVYRLAELIVAGITIPDIPVLIKLITG